ncbi:unnamed protein product [Prorocentrum cordatum]|uniref:Uncharacterized protein n=1 Tax=Prorocentrum cordatum TaxID=2364126 RepID=A0ABN9X9S8_9DINO|nr:unnamed protein product [Polarella glacialis]
MCVAIVGSRSPFWAGRCATLSPPAFAVTMLANAVLAKETDSLGRRMPDAAADLDAAILEAPRVPSVATELGAELEPLCPAADVASVAAPPATDAVAAAVPVMGAPPLPRPGLDGDASSTEDRAVLRRLAEETAAAAAAGMAAPPTPRELATPEAEAREPQAEACRWMRGRAPRGLARSRPRGRNRRRTLSGWPGQG